MKHQHLVGHTVRITRLPEGLGYLNDTVGKLVDPKESGYLVGPGLRLPYAVLVFGRGGIHMNISLDNEGEYDLSLDQ